MLVPEPCVSNPDQQKWTADTKSQLLLDNVRLQAPSAHSSASAAAPTAVAVAAAQQLAMPVAAAGAAAERLGL